MGERTYVNYQDYTELKYCAAIFKESMRLYPSAPLLDRVTTEDMNINGLLIPKNSIIWVNFYALVYCIYIFK